MANDSYGSVSRCRVYVDYIQYAKAIGMINNFSYSTGRVSSNNPEALWDMNPSNVAEFTIIDAGDGTFTAGTFRANFKYVGDDTAGLQFRNLISTTNYGALLGHNVGLFDPNRYVESKVQDGYASQSGILGRNTCKNNIGTNIWKINHFVLGGNPIEDLAYFDRLGFKINKGTEGLDWNVGDVIRMGAFSTGRYFDLPVNANLSVNQTFSYDGVQTKRTFGGADLTQVNHTRKKWGDLGAWTHIDLSEYNNPSDALNNEDYSTAGFQGKRSWDLAWSFISKEDMFPMNFENNMSGYYSTQEELGEQLITSPENYNFNSDGGIWYGHGGATVTWGSSYGESSTGGLRIVGDGDGNEGAALSTAGYIEEALNTQYKITASIKGATGQLDKFQIGIGSSKSEEFSVTTSFASYTKYITTASSGSLSILIHHDNDGTDPFYIDNVLIQKVITPSGTWFDNDSGVHTDNIVGNFLNYTCFGTIPFIFQPDNTKTTFAICVLDKPSISIKRVAPDLYNIKMKIVEI